MNRNKVRAMGAAVVVASLFLAGCSANDGAAPGPSGDTDANGVVLDENGFASYTGEAEKGGTLRVLNSVDFSHLDPAMGNDGNVNDFYRLIYRQLTTVENKEGSDGSTVVGDLATDAGTPNADATEWTYTLKDNIFYQDGTPITAADIKFGLERSLDPALAIGVDYHKTYIKGASDYAGVYKDPAGLDSIKVTGDKTITFELNQPLPAFPSVATTNTFTPFPKDAGVTTTSLDEMPIASGPYKVTSYTRGSSLKLERNDKWDQSTDDVRLAYPDNWDFLFGLDAATVDQRMISGQGEDKNAMSGLANPLLAASLSRVQEPALKSRVVKGIPFCTTFLALNTTKGPLGDLKVRQAISYAVDKSSVLASSGGPAMAQIATDMLTPAVPGRQDFDLYPSEGNKGDVEKAKALLKEAGFEDGFKVTLDARAIPKWQAQAESVQQSLKRVGIDVTLNVIDAATYYGVISTPAQQHDMAISGWCSAWLSGAPLLETLFSGDRIYEAGNWNLAQLDDPKINARFDEIAQMSDLDKQNEEYGKLDREIMELAPYVPLVRDTPLMMVGENIGNAYSHAGEYGYVDFTSVGLKNAKG